MDLQWHLTTIPPGSTITRHERDGLTIIIDWIEPDGSLHQMRVSPDASSVAGVRVVEFVTTVAPDFKVTIGSADEPRARI